MFFASALPAATYGNSSGGWGLGSSDLPWLPVDTGFGVGCSLLCSEQACFWLFGWIQFYVVTNGSNGKCCRALLV